MEVNTELHGEDAQSRFRLLEKPVAFPGNCVVCGAVDRPVLDFGAEVEIEGRGFGALYFCITCIAQAYSKLPQEETPEHFCTNEAEVIRIKDEVFCAVASALRDFKPSDGSGDSRVSDNSGESSDEGSESGAAATADEADESSSKPRSANVSDLNSSGLATGLVFDL